MTEPKWDDPEVVLIYCNMGPFFDNPRNYGKANLEYNYVLSEIKLRGRKQFEKLKEYPVTKKDCPACRQFNITRKYTDWFNDNREEAIIFKCQDCGYQWYAKPAFKE
jgi:ribosomal protein L37AE/L43A